MSKIISLSGEVGYEITARNLKRQLPTDNSEVLLTVNSTGGYISDGIEVYNVIDDYKGVINSRIDGIAASAASYFIMASDKVIVRKNSIFMAHKAWSFMVGDADNMQTEANVLNGIDEILSKEYADKTGKSKDEILKEMKNEIWLIGAENILEYGAADIQMEDDDNNDDGNDLDFQAIEAKARIAVKATKQRMKDAKDSEDELNRISALIHINNQASIVEPDSKKNKEEAKTMNEAELKEKYPDACNAIVAQEKDRVSAYMVFNDIDPEGVKAGIESGLPLSEKQKAEFSRKSMNKAILEGIQNDSSGNVETETPAEDEESAEAKALNEKLTAKYSGGAK